MPLTFERVPIIADFRSSIITATENSENIIDTITGKIFRNSLGDSRIEYYDDPSSLLLSALIIWNASLKNLKMTTPEGMLDFNNPTFPNEKGMTVDVHVPLQICPTTSYKLIRGYKCKKILLEPVISIPSLTYDIETWVSEELNLVMLSVEKEHGEQTHWEILNVELSEPSFSILGIPDNLSQVSLG